MKAVHVPPLSSAAPLWLRRLARGSRGLLAVLVGCRPRLLVLGWPFVGLQIMGTLYTLAPMFLASTSVE